MSLHLLLLSLTPSLLPHEYRRRFMSKGNAFVFQRQRGIYSSSPPTTSPPTLIPSPSSGRRQENIGGSAYGGQRAVCCTSDLAKLGVCSHGEIIHHPSAKDSAWPQVFGVSFVENELSAGLLTRSIQITRTGMYNLYFIHCDPNLKDVVCARFWREVLPLQNCVTLVITLGMCEMALWYFDYAEFNETGVIMLGVTFFAASETLELLENVGASLSATFKKLQTRRLLVKLDVYRKFTNALAVAILVSVGMHSLDLLVIQGEFEKDDYTLTLIKPSPVPSHEVKNLSEARSLQADTEEPDLEEDKRE
ncbi:hypothetical protein Bca52824_084166 [Brassica carinata]|uniref:GOST seven transmembrane domain-containing protein n=1 Tax=Brassica carinata TaxID=52824 RepID=A0A8X7PM37_BRACI|nr:hypothetical protein Bca52824_084166 [Brassica carinata]